MRKTELLNCELSVHLSYYKQDPENYLLYSKEIFESLENKNKAYIVSTLLQNLNKKFVTELPLDIDEVLTACEILDSKRNIKNINSKLEKINIDCKKYEQLKKIKENFEKISENNNFTLTLSKIKILKNWIKKIPEEKLIYQCLFPEKISKWKKISQICHFKNSDFSSNLFLNYCFNKNYPKNSLIAKVLSEKNNTFTFENCKDIIVGDTIDNVNVDNSIVDNSLEEPFEIEENHIFKNNDEIANSQGSETLNLQTENTNSYCLLC